MLNRNNNQNSSLMATNTSNLSPGLEVSTELQIDHTKYKLEAGATLLVWMLLFGAFCATLFTILQLCRSFYRKKWSEIDAVDYTRTQNGLQAMYPGGGYGSRDPYAGQTIAMQSVSSFDTYTNSSNYMKSLIGPYF